MHISHFASHYMFTEQELNKIFMWLPYRSDWPVDDHRAINSIHEYFSALIHEFNNNSHFAATQMHDGGYTNYLEFVCYPAGRSEYNDIAILVRISLCAPLAAYGETRFTKDSRSFGHTSMEPEAVRTITNNNLKAIEKEVVSILTKHHLTIIGSAFASTPLPQEVAENMKTYNLESGSQYLHGLFQWMD